MQSLLSSHRPQATRKPCLNSHNRGHGRMLVSAEVGVARSEVLIVVFVVLVAVVVAACCCVPLLFFCVVLRVLLVLLACLLLLLFCFVVI